jgi:hypothetical protein
MENANIPANLRKEAQGSCALGVGEFLSSYCVRMRSHLDFLASKSDVASRWYTHTNPAGCWICDTFVVGYTLLGVLRQLAEQIERETELDNDREGAGRRLEAEVRSDKEESSPTIPEEGGNE